MAGNRGIGVSAGFALRTCLVAVVACGGASPLARAQASASDTTDLPPAGYGTLRQEAVTIRIRTDVLEIRAFPLDERVIRLLAPDTYASFHRLLEDRRPEIDTLGERNGVESPTLVFVSFFGVQEGARFQPELLTITAQNRLFRPMAIVPLTPQWSAHQLTQRQTASGIYLFERGIRVLDPFDVTYDGVTSSDWARRLRTLDQERASVLARARRGP